MEHKTYNIKQKNKIKNLLKTKNGFTPTPVKNNFSLKQSKKMHGIENKIFNKNKKNQVWGFTLIETIIAIGILLTGVMAVFTLLTFNIAQTANMKNKIIAVNLAQEGVEVVRNIRDNCWFSGIAWSSCLPIGAYNVNYNSLTINDLDNGLSFDGTYYVHSALPNTNFQRIITISDNPDNDITTEDKKVESKVTWGNSVITIEEILYNWAL